MTELQDERPRILIDKREGPSGLIQELRNRASLNITERVLETGDLVIGELGIERKTVRDFEQSRNDGRLYCQVKMLRRAYRRSIIILEGSSYGEGPRLNLAGIRRALITIAVRWQLPVLRTGDVYETACLIEEIARDENAVNLFRAKDTDGAPRVRLSSRKKFCIEGIPGVGTKKAHNLLMHFNTIRDVVDAPPEELLKVNGITPGLARRITSFVTEPYALPNLEEAQNQLALPLLCESDSKTPEENKNAA